ncbi:MAG: class I SAM-dependent methyltransferase [bacterium]|nr:class I SAM-dependent methyltransferase [bacterium]
MSDGAAETPAWSAAFAAPELARRRRRTYEGKLQRLDLLRPVAGRTLDVACGHGDALRILSHHGHQRLVGLDTSRHSNDPQPFEQMVADGTRLPFADLSFERVLCLHSLHHFRSFEDIGHFLAECRRVLTRGGYLYLLDHRGSFWLRGLFHMLEWRCPLYPASARRFGEQLREEHDAIFWWLAEWRQLFDTLRRTGFAVERQTRTAAFLYLRCRVDE